MKRSLNVSVCFLSIRVFAVALFGLGQAYCRKRMFPEASAAVRKYLESV